MSRVPRRSRDRHPPPQRELLRAALPPSLRGASGEDDRRVRDDGAWRPRLGRRVRRQGLAGALGRSSSPWLHGRRALPRTRHRGLQRRVRRARARVRARTGRHACRDRLAGGLRVRHPERRKGRQARAVLRVWAFEETPLRSRRAGGRLRRRRDGPQPRRRGRRALRERAALEHRLPRGDNGQCCRRAVASPAR